MTNAAAEGLAFRIDAQLPLFARAPALVSVPVPLLPVAADAVAALTRVLSSPAGD